MIPRTTAPTKLQLLQAQREEDSAQAKQEFLTALGRSSSLHQSSDTQPAAWGLRTTLVVLRSPTIPPTVYKLRRLAQLGHEPDKTVNQRLSLRNRCWFSCLDPEFFLQV